MEPPTEGKVILHTNRGPFDIELWAKEAPKAVRNFVQLCLEGYYNGTSFHRVIKDFMIQGGDPTGTGEGGESIYGQEFMDEIHSRLRFTHRGILAMASNGPNTNGSQFFVTLDKCEWLNRKHTIFGKIAGESIFNVVKAADGIDVDENDRPIDSFTTIIKTEVLWNPFEDCFPRPEKTKYVEPEVVDLRPKKKMKKNLSLLSFGEEQEDEDKEIEEITKKSRGKSKSAHDILDQENLGKDVDEDVAKAADEVGKHPDEEKLHQLKAAVKAHQKNDEEEEEEEEEAQDPNEAGLDFAERMRRQMQLRSARLNVAKNKGKTQKQIEKMSAQRMEEMIDFKDSDEESEDEDDDRKTKKKQKKKESSDEAEDDEVREKKTKLNLKKARKIVKEELKDDSGFKIAGERSGAERRAKREVKKLTADREKFTLAKLDAFRSALKEDGESEDAAGKKRKAEEAEVPKSWKPVSMADKLAAISDEEEEDEDDEGWQNHTLSFERTAADIRREKAQMESLETKDSRVPGKGDNRSFHERRLRPDLSGKGEGKVGKGKGKGFNSSRW